jgi:hypothetical protein
VLVLAVDMPYRLQAVTRRPAPIPRFQAMPGFTPDLKRILRANDCEFIKTDRGDHEIWWSPITERKITVDKSRHTANAVLKQAGLKKAF